MDETTALIYRGINLAKELEANMPNLVTNELDVLSNKCEEIIKVFSNVKNRVAPSGDRQMKAIDIHDSEGGGGGELHAAAQEYNMNSSGGGLFQEWLRINSTMQPPNTMELDHAQHFVTDDLEAPQEGQLANRIPGLDSSRSMSSSQRQRRRKDENGKRAIRVAAAQIGNIDVPQEDGFTWRKYGQKEILGAKFPRAYYRCTHQKLYNCPAKKQVQRLDDDPFTFEVTYRGEHQCYLTSTAPSIPPSSLEIGQEMNILELDTSRGFHTLPIMPLQAVPTTSPLGHWLSMNVNNQSSGEGTSARGNFGTNTNNIGASSSSSAMRYGRDAVDYQNVADLANVMFNSGSSSNNSMELIFSAMEENVSTNYYNTEEKKD